MDLDRLGRLFWWEDAQSRSPERVAAQVMVIGDLQDIREVRHRFGEGIFRRVLASPPRGIFDARSWSYWHKKVGHDIIPPLPDQPVPWPR